MSDRISLDLTCYEQRVSKIEKRMLESEKHMVASEKRMLDMEAFVVTTLSVVFQNKAFVTTLIEQVGATRAREIAEGASVYAEQLSGLHGGD